MSAEKTLFLVIPLFNEEENIESLVKSIFELRVIISSYTIHVICIDDGSSDSTISMLKKYREDSPLLIDILSYGENRGPGYAFQYGFQYLHGKYSIDDIIITMEGDNTSKVEVIRYMINRIEFEGTDIVLASPYAYGGGILNTGMFRQIISYFANTLIRIFLGVQGIHTFSSFFRAFKADAFQKLQAKYSPEIIDYEGFECMVELLKKSIDEELTITEIPMSVDTKLRKGSSKMRVFKTIIGYLKLMIHLSRK